MTESSKVSAKDLSTAARELLDADMVYDSAELMAKAGDAEGLNLLRAKAIDEGNFFLYQITYRLQKKEPIGDELRALADKASSLGLMAYEKSARDLLNDLA
jgi:hypothetical protein